MDALTYISTNVPEWQQKLALLPGETQERQLERGMDPVGCYYDPTTQSFFEDLVKFVSHIRGQLRKAQLAQKTASIKKLIADQGTQDDDDDGGQPRAVLKLYARGKRGPNSGPAGTKELFGKALDYVQAVAEKAALEALVVERRSGSIYRLGILFEKSRPLE
jgi:hypothetical protein